ncbi:MAG TPA: hypothetical protein ENN99_12925 [Chloroflexi bacterium]|nr:hypothetical protein [Chloroflexota bacterium]
MKKERLYLIGSLVVFAVLFVAAGIATTWSAGYWREVVMFSPVFPAIGVGFFAARTVGKLDELQQRIHLEALAFSMVNTLLATLVISLPLGHYALTGSPIWYNRETPIVCIFPISISFLVVGFWMARRRYR